MLPHSGVAILTDSNVKGIYGDRFPDFPVLQVSPGEESKKLEVVEMLAGKLLRQGSTGRVHPWRRGGVVCDLAGFLASIYMRGIRCAYVSTSCCRRWMQHRRQERCQSGRCQERSRCFRQPEFVICDPLMLSTMPEEEFKSGLAEL
jgi:3-dehydroquinate synthase